MADIKYLYYGDQQIDEQALLNKMASEVNTYVQSQPWTRKRKEMFMSAYSDIINGGLKGASSNTGQWIIDYGGPYQDPSTRDKKLQQMYGEAAYFIQQQMSKLATSTKKEEEKKEDKEELPKFTNEEFTKQFQTQLLNDWFGGMNASTQEWNEFDTERDSQTGKRSTKKRAEKFAKTLKNYSDSLKEGEYDFTGSPFSSLEDFKSKIQKAIDALKTKDIDDDNEALYAIGIKPSDYFNNGTGDLSNYYLGQDNKIYNYAISGGTQLPWGQAAQLLRNQNLEEDEKGENKEPDKLNQQQNSNISPRQPAVEVISQNIYSDNDEQYRTALKEIEKMRAALVRYKKYIGELTDDYRNPNTGNKYAEIETRFSEKIPQEGIVEFNGEKFKLSRILPSYNNPKNQYKITRISGNTTTIPFPLSKTFDNILDVKKTFANILKNSEAKDERTIKAMLEFEKLGWLKQGGKITDSQIDNFLKQYKV